MKKTRKSYVAEKIDKEYRQRKHWEEKLKKQKENKK